MKSRKVKLSKSPLVALLMQIQFTPILKIEDYVPEIQNFLRRNEFPLFDRLEAQNFEVNSSGQIIRNDLKQWFFSSVDYQHNIIIDNQRVTLQLFDSNKYEYKKIANQFEVITNSINKIIDFPNIKRIGLRYINAISNNEVSYKELLNYDYRIKNLPKEINQVGEALYSYSANYPLILEEISTKSEFSLRIYQNKNGVKLPPDILKLPIEDKETKKQLVTFLDLDHFINYANAEPASKILPTLSQIFDNLHVVIEQVFFDSLISEEALRVWQ